MSESEYLFNVGDVIDEQYRVVKLLGSGAFGEVYRAEQMSGGESVAVKILLPVYSSDPETVRRFQDEGKYLLRIREERRTLAFPKVFANGFDKKRNVHYLALELIEGDQILTEMQRYPQGMPHQQAIRYTVSVLVAVADMHDVGIVHRDLKPENVMRSPDGTIRILDLGIARSILGEDDRRTKTGALIGTPDYMPPEQCLGKNIDERVDLFAVASMLYEMLTGKAPFHGDTPTETLSRIIDPTYPPPSLPPSIPSHIQEAVMMGLQKDRAKRWRAAREFIDALEKDGSEAEHDARRSPTTFQINPFATTADPGMAVSRPPPPATNLRPIPASRTSSSATPSGRNGSLKMILAGLGAIMAVGAILIVALREPHPPTQLPPRAGTAHLVQQDTPLVTAVTPRDAGATLSQDAELVVAPPPHSSPDAAVTPAEHSARRSRRDAGRSADRPRRPHAPHCRRGYTLTNSQCCRDLGGGAMDCDGNE